MDHNQPWKSNICVPSAPPYILQHALEKQPRTSSHFRKIWWNSTFFFSSSKPHIPNTFFACVRVTSTSALIIQPAFKYQFPKCIRRLFIQIKGTCKQNRVKTTWHLTPGSRLVFTCVYISWSTRNNGLFTSIVYARSISSLDRTALGTRAPLGLRKRVLCATISHSFII